MSSHAPADRTAPPALAKALRQEALLAERPSRAALLALTPDWPLRTARIAVVRNAPFEPVAAVAAPFLAQADLAADWRWSDYDDSLGLAGLDDGADAVLLWLDFRRYRLDRAALAAFVGERLAAIRERVAAPVLVADSPDDPALNGDLAAAARRIPGVTVYPRSLAAERLGEAYRDPRLLRLAGDDLSAAAGVEHARELGLDWLPALLSPPLKALALDLDNTLYEGVLGEDGPEGVALSDTHRALQSRLADLHRAGLLLALVSRNEPQDVDALFAARPDFPLRPDMISARAIGWGGKDRGVADIAAALNIGAEAVLFVDDNPGEVAQVAAALPGTPILWAADPARTLRGLSLFPGLRRLRRGREDALRAHDLSGRAERARLTASGQDYVAALHPRLGFAVATSSTLARLQELSIKTNQFNLALARLTAAEAATYVQAGGRAAASAALADDLSDSGVILSMFARREGETMIVDDLCVSCRALGRGLETAMILEAAVGLAERLGAASVAFTHRSGPRNAPARAWLADLNGEALPDEGRVLVSLDAARRRLADVRVARTWRADGPEE